MKTIKIIEAPESLESMILGINSDPKRKMFDEMLKTLEDYSVTRVKDASKVQAEVFVNDKEVFVGYPNQEEFAMLLDLDKKVFCAVSYSSDLLEGANTTRLGACCGVGEDIYLDPNEE